MEMTPKEVKKAVALFDFDGVISDTESQYSAFWNRRVRGNSVQELKISARKSKGRHSYRFLTNTFRMKMTGDSLKGKLTSWNGA